MSTGINEESESAAEANECFVMLLTAINDAWKLPVGYFLINCLTGEQKAHLVRICIEMVEETGIKIVAFIDPCHAIKLIRNAFGDLGVIVDGDSNKIDFKYIKYMHNRQ